MILVVGGGSRRPQKPSEKCLNKFTENDENTRNNTDNMSPKGTRGGDQKAANKQFVLWVLSNSKRALIY